MIVRAVPIDMMDYFSVIAYAFDQVPSSRTAYFLLYCLICLLRLQMAVLI